MHLHAYFVIRQKYLGVRNDYLKVVIKRRVNVTVNILQLFNSMRRVRVANFQCSTSEYTLGHAFALVLSSFALVRGVFH